MSATNEFPSLKLNTGASIPQIGLGTWQSSEEDAYKAVLAALQNGYRHIDTAAIYRNEAPVGKAIKDSGIPREEIFVTTKLWGTQQDDPETALKQSLERLGLDYVDLYLMHWPVPLKRKNADGDYLVFGEDNVKVEIENWNFVKTWEKMQSLPKSGKVKAIGVSNFSVKNLEELLKANPDFIVPAANQVEIHPQLPQTELIDYCKSKGILIEAYSPLGSTSSALLTDPTLKEIATKYDAEPANILINWGASRGYVVLPKSANPIRVKSNLKHLKLSNDDLEKVSKIADSIGYKRYVKPNFAPFPIFE